MAERLTATGADVVAADPHVLAEQVPDGVRLVEPTAGEIAAAAAVVVLVDHDVFDLELVAA